MGETWYQKLIIALRENLPYVAIIALSAVVIFVFKLYVAATTRELEKAEEELKFWKNSYIKTNEQWQTEKRIENSRTTYGPGIVPPDDGRGGQK